MRTTAVGLSGAIGSGKTTVAASVHKLLGGVLVSFGDYVRAEAKKRGRVDTRESLQAQGELLIAEAGWDGFCRATLSHFGWHHGDPVVIDGIRHVEVVTALRHLIAPGRLALVFVSVDDAVRAERLRIEGLSEDRRRARVEAHSTESQVRGPLLDLADFIVDGTRPAERSAESIVEWLSTEPLSGEAT